MSPSSPMHLRQTPVLVFILTGLLSPLCGCQHVNVAQITYEMLRAEDCRRNQLDDFCARTYASEYYEYVQLRQNFLLDQENRRLPVYVDGVPLEDVNNSF